MLEHGRQHALLQRSEGCASEAGMFVSAQVTDGSLGSLMVSPGSLGSVDLQMGCARACCSGV
jgi:hypothetical protein